MWEACGDGVNRAPSRRLLPNHANTVHQVGRNAHGVAHDDREVVAGRRGRRDHSTYQRSSTDEKAGLAHPAHAPSAATCEDDGAQVRHAIGLVRVAPQTRWSVCRT